MTLNRRDLILGAGSALALTGLSAAPAAAATAERVFKAYRGRKHVGGQILTVTRSGTKTSVRLQTELQDRFLVWSIRYKLDSTEIWKNGVLQSIKSSTVENDTRDYVNARRTGAGLEIDGSRFSGVVGGNPASSSFFVPEIAMRTTWISTQSGKPFQVGARPAGKTRFETGSGAVTCTKYECAGQLKIPVDAYFTEDAELAGYVAHIKSLKVRSIAQSMDQKLAPLWA